MLVSVGTSKLGPIGAQMILSIQINFKKEIQSNRKFSQETVRLVKKIRPNSRILSITTQSRFFISLHLHNVYKAISSLLVLYFFF